MKSDSKRLKARNNPNWNSFKLLIMNALNSNPFFSLLETFQFWFRYVKEFAHPSSPPQLLSRHQFIAPNQANFLPGGCRQPTFFGISNDSRRVRSRLVCQFLLPRRLTMSVEINAPEMGR